MKRMIAVGIALIGVGLIAVGGYAQEQKMEEKPAKSKGICWNNCVARTTGKNGLWMQ